MSKESDFQAERPCVCSIPSVSNVAMVGEILKIKDVNMWLYLEM